MTAIDIQAENWLDDSNDSQMLSVVGLGDICFKVHVGARNNCGCFLEFGLA
jgi:hypothetical protein